MSYASGNSFIRAVAQAKSFVRNSISTGEMTGFEPYVEGSFARIFSSFSSM